MQDFFLSPDKKRKNLDIMEAKIFQIAHRIRKELESGVDLGDINLKKLNKEDLGNIVYQIISKGKFYAKINLEVIKYFLNKFTKYGNFEGDKELFLSKLSMSMHVEIFPKDYLLFRKNDIGDKFYIILKGSVSIVITQEINIEMTEKEYNIHIEKLRYYKEYNLLDSILSFDNKIEIYDELKETIKDEIYLESIKDKKPTQSPNPENPQIINPKNFVERVEPFSDKDSKAPKISVKIPIYKIVANLTTGETFGEVALSKSDLEERKRTATVITDTESIFGIVPNTVYSTFLREVEEKARYNLSSQLVSHTLFKSFLPEAFLKANFLNYFNNMNFKLGEFLFKQGDIKNSLFFVNDGIINLYTESSIDNIIKIIEHLNKDVIKELKKEKNKSVKNELNEKDGFEIIKEYQLQTRTNSLFKKFCRINRIFKIFSINKKETLGFDDCLLNDDTFFTSAKIMSENSHVFVLKLNFLNSILKENVISRNYKRTNIEKRKIMINRLTNMVRMLFARFLRNNKMSISKDEYLEEKKRDEIKILKSENISFKAIKNKKEKYSLTKFGYKNYFTNLKNKRKNNAKYINIIKPKLQLNLDRILFQNKIEKEKEKHKTIKSPNFKNKLLNIHINFSNDNIQNSKKIRLPFLNKMSSFHKAKEKKDKYKDKYETGIIKINSDEHIEKINKLIPNIKKLSSTYMIDKYERGKMKIKNMTQFDFIFFDNLFLSQGKRKYSKAPLEINC